MKSTVSTSTRPSRFVARLGKHHFAHLRGVAKGMDPGVSARHYLGIEHGHEAVTAHRQTVDAVRAVARRSSSGSAWRLIGLTIRPKTQDALKPPQKPAGSSALTGRVRVPTLDEFIDERDLDGWSEGEVLKMYTEAYPPVPSEVKEVDRRAKLLEKQLHLLADLEALSVEIPQPTDMVNGWYDELTSCRLIAAGVVTLSQLHTAIRIAGRWYSAMPGIGKGKASRIAAFLNVLLPEDAADLRPQFALAAGVSPFTPFREIIEGIEIIEGKEAGELSGQRAANALLRADSDLEATRSWINARAGSAKTAVVYMREATRLLLWLQRQRSAMSYGAMQVEDCLDYMAFLQNIPLDWISRRKAAPFTCGWAPFRGQLSQESYKQTITIIAALFQFLHASGYIQVNPWILINKKTGDSSVNSSTSTVKQSKAISEFGFSEIVRFVDNQEPSAASERVRFIFMFLESVGLRSMEFLNARLEHFEHQPEGWVLHVTGKGSKNRYAFIPDQAFGALQRYLGFRGHGGIETADMKLPLLASVMDTYAPIGYQAFYETVKLWTVKAIRQSSLPAKERSYLEGASPHWLRHTFGTRSVARDVAMDAIQAQMGHASIKTTMDIYGRAPMKRRASEIGKAFT